MIYGIYTVWDSKAQSYMQPFFSVTPGAAIRSFTDASRNPESMLQQHPEDFSLFKIGDFDDQTAETASHPPHALGTGSDYTGGQPDLKGSEL